MKFIKGYERFVETVVSNAPTKPVVKPGVDTPTRTRPSRPGVIPGQRPSEQDAPLALKSKGPEATLEDIVNRLINISDNEGIDLEKLITK